MAQTNQVTKIYEMKTLGYDVTHKEFQQLHADLEKLRKAKIDLNNAKGKLVDPSEITDVTTKIDAVTKKQVELTSKSAGAYFQLTKQFKDAKENLQNLAAEFGTESEQVKNATAILQDYKEQLTAINNLGKLKPVAPVVPITTNTSSTPLTSTTNVAELNAEIERTANAAGTAVSELELKEMEAANAATAWVDSQVLGKNAAGALAEEVERISTPLEQYTGSLRENIKQNIQYKSRLAEISAELKAGKGNTAALVQEQAFLKNASAELSQTINAQTKYLQAAEGSNDQLNATLGISRNLLRQLSEEERQQPWALQVAKDVTELDVKLKTLDAGMGNHQRNVGDYKQAYNGLSNSIQQILRESPSAAVSMQTFFLAISNNLPIFFDEIDKIRKAQKEANIVAQAAAVAAKEQAIATALAAGATEQAAVAEGELAAQTVIANAASERGPGIIKRIISSLFTLQTGLTVAVLLLTLFGQQVFAMTSQMIKGTKSTLDLQKANEDLNEEIKNTGKGYSEAVVNLEILNARVLTAKKSFSEKQEILKDYNKEFGDTIGKAKDYNDVEKLLRDKTGPFIEAMRLRAQAQAAMNLAVKENEATLNRQLQGDQAISTLQKERAEFIKNGELSGARLKEYDKMISNQKKIAQNDIKENTDRKKFFEDRFTQLTLEADLIDRKNKIDSDPEKEKKQKTPRADRLSVDEQNALKRIEATRKTDLAEENTYANEIQKVRKLTFDEETGHLLAVEKINKDALEDKIALFAKKKKLNAEELAQVAEFKEQISLNALQTSKQIQAIEKQRFTDEETNLKNSLDLQKQAIKDKLQAVTDDPNASATTKAQAKLDADTAILEAEQNFYTELLKLSSDYNDQALVTAKKGIEAQKKLREQDRKDVLLASIQDGRNAAATQITETNINYARLRTAVLENDRLSDEQKKKQIEKLNKAERRTILSQELAQLNIEVEKKQALLALSLLSNEDYQKAVAAQTKKAEELAKNTSGDDETEKQKKKFTDFQSFIQTSLRSLFKSEPGDELDNLIGQAVAQSFDLASSAMHNYFDQERSRIQESLQLNLERLDNDKSIALGRAQSKAEEQAIERKYAAEKRRMEIEAGEQLKKSKRSEAKIALIAELSNIAVSAAANPANGVTFGAAGALMYALLSGLAVGRYALNISQINAQKFAGGGQVQPLRNGLITTAPNIAMQPNGDNVLATVKPGEVILNRWQQMMLGGADTFRSIGVPGFAGGGYVGSNLQAPVFSPAISNVMVSNGGSLELLEAINGLRQDQQRTADETSKRIDRLEVVQVTNSVTRAQKKEVRQSEIGTL